MSKATWWVWYFNGLRAMSQAGPFMALRETFISLLPFYIASSVLEFWVSAADPATRDPLWMAVNLAVHGLHHGLTQFFPLLVSMALGSTLARRMDMDAFHGGALSAFCLFLSVFHLESQHSPDLAMKMAALFGVLLPFLAVHTLRFAQRHAPRVVRDAGLSPLLSRNINLIVPGIVTVAVVHLVALQCAAGFAALQFEGNLFANWPLVLQGVVRMVAVNLLWAVGLHGENLFNLIVGRDMLAQMVLPGFTLASLLNTFVLFGGSGGTLSLLLAMALNGKVSALGKISVPFQLFNINEIIVYGHPVVFNPYLMLPFVLFPVAGFLVAYAAVSWGWVAALANVQWMMPIGLSAYVVGGGHASTFVLQAAMLLLGSAIYTPFLRLERRDSMVHKLEKMFAEDARPQSDMADAAETRYAGIYEKRLLVYADAMQAMDLISAGRMRLWYQPKIDVATSRVCGFEALLRVELPDGKIVGPAFVAKLEAAGYSHTINTWVVQEAMRDLEAWQAQGFMPVVSLNLTADFLASAPCVGRIIERVGALAPQVKLEMLESSFCQDFEQTRRNVHDLAQAGIRLAIDDFGSGYSNLALLNKLEIETIKIDRSLLADLGSEKGRVLYRQLCAMILQLDYEVVAEGVETPEVAAFVTACGVTVIQGWVHAAAMPAAKAMAYALDRGMLPLPPWRGLPLPAVQHAADTPASSPQRASMTT